MENAIQIEELKKMTIGDIKKLESQQAGIHNMIESQKEKLKYYNKEIKTGNFAEDLINNL